MFTKAHFITGGNTRSPDLEATCDFTFDIIQDGKCVDQIVMKFLAMCDEEYRLFEHFSKKEFVGQEQGVWKADEEDLQGGKLTVSEYASPNVLRIHIFHASGNFYTFDRPPPPPYKPRR